MLRLDARDAEKPPVGVPPKFGQGEGGSYEPLTSGDQCDGREVSEPMEGLPVPPPDQQTFLKLSHREHEVSGRTSGYQEVIVCPNHTTLAQRLKQVSTSHSACQFPKRQPSE